MSGFWRSPRGENHGNDSKPGDVWVKVEFDGAGHFDYSWGSTTYQIEIGKDYLRVHEGGDCLFVVELQEPPSNDAIRAMIKAYYVGRQDGKGRGRIMLQHQLRELLGAAMSKP